MTCYNKHFVFNMYLCVYVVDLRKETWKQLEMEKHRMIDNEKARCKLSVIS